MPHGRPAEAHCIVVFLGLGVLVCLALMDVIKQEVAWWWLPKNPSVAQCESYLTNYRSSWHIPAVERKLDEARWVDTRKLNTEKAYREYVERKPDGLHSLEARWRWEPLLWRQVDDRVDRESLEEYLAVFPSGVHSCEVCRRLATLSGTRKNFVNTVEKCKDNELVRRWAQARVASIDARDDKAFRLTIKQNSIEGFRNYLNDFPEGQHRAEANDRIEHSKTLPLCEQSYHC